MQNMKYDWIKLLDWHDDYIAIGTVIKFSAKGWFDSDEVVCMFFGSFRYLIAAEVYVIEGEHAGAHVLYIPQNGTLNPKEHSNVSVKWLLDNWNANYIHLCDVSNVYLSSGVCV
jgi:hypothetical protein